MTKKKAPTVEPTAKKLSRWVEEGVKKLASSGLTLEDAKTLGIDILSADEMAAEGGGIKKLMGLRFQYFDIHGQPARDVPKADPYARYRYLEDPKDFSASTDKAQRYAQKVRTLPMAYYPKNHDWAVTTKDASAPLIITEGELKAAKACKEGFPTIGIGGVHNWKSTKHGITWLPSFTEINWVRRRVIIVFDSDARTNPNINIATWDLAQALIAQGAFVYFLYLPAIDGVDKTGLDDYLTYAGGDTAQKLTELLADAEPLGLATPLWKLNERFVYVANPGFIVDQRTNFKIAPNAFISHHQAHVLYQEKVLRPNGTISYKPVSAAAHWIKWPMRHEVDGITYAPGKEYYVEEKGLRKLNTWPGLGVEPVKGDVTPFLELLKHLLTGNEEWAMPWTLMWFAYPIQNPGTKLFTALTFYGLRHGTGKTLIGETMKRIYGKNYVLIEPKMLHGEFTAWAENKQFGHGDEVVTRDTKRGEAENLKLMITRPEIRINEKFIPAYTIPDCINYYFTTNHSDALVLENDDRRQAIFEVQVGPLPEEFYTKYKWWLDHGGAEALLHYLLYEVDCEEFNPAAPAPRSTAKERMIEANFTDHTAWVHQLLDTPEHVLRIGDVPIHKDLFTSKELYDIYCPDGKSNISVMGLGRELVKCGFRQVYQGRSVTLPDGRQVRCFAVRNADYWLKASSKDVVAHLVEYESTGKTKKRKF